MARMHAIPLRHDDVFYPESDGQPMAETEIHLHEIIYLIEAFSTRFEAEDDVYVGGDLLLYYRQGNPRQVVCPDVMVVRGVPKLPMRRTFKLWEEGEAPCLVVEVTSPSTQGNDFAGKKELYERLGIEEYVLYDPLAERLPQLQGFRLADDGCYRPVDPEPDGALVSRTTGVTLRMEEERIRMVETATGRPFLRDAEIRRDAAEQERALAAARQTAAEQERALAAARQAATALEEEVARLRREVERLSKG
jgi:Uma2 family endonuclease